MSRGWVEDHRMDVRVLVAGAPGVGKSCTLLRFADDLYIESSVVLIGVTVKIRTMDVGDRSIKVTAVESQHGKPKKWSSDGSGQERADAYVIMYDVTEPSTLGHARGLIDRGVSLYPSDAVVTLAGNKSDLERRVPLSEAQVIAAHRGFHVIEVSAKTGENMDIMFKDLVRRVVAKKSGR